ncbi:MULTISPECIES: GntR family transcriptional regulator [unclassified Variovorax]|uniref:GntR family transcriptional regulator n=1 Tax=unclassified Variovorax TaxID=663243 RepID=UPI003F47E98A
MLNTPSELERYLGDLARDAQPGVRVPSIRDLMRRFGVSQAIVTRAFDGLRDRGLISSEVGRGTFFHAGEAMAERKAVKPLPASRSVLLLRRTMGIQRSRVLIQGLQRRFTDAGHRVLEVSYTDPAHAHEVLRGLPSFDACLIQSTFETITIGMLATLRDKATALAVDGAALTGLDVDAVGMEWGEPLGAAAQLLQQLGHRQIAYATTTHPFLANQLGLKRWAQLGKAQPQLNLQNLPVPKLSHEDYEVALVDLIKAKLDGEGRLPFTAMVCWGIEDGRRFRALLSEIGVDIPTQLSVVLLGRADLENEHADFFETLGCNVADQIDFLYRAINTRWQEPGRPYVLELIPLAHKAGHSVASPQQ